jgi:hypothetical protein
MSVRGFARVKANLSGLLFRSAQLLADRARAIEHAQRGTADAPVEAELDEHRSCALGAVIMAAGALEASINELFADVEDGNTDKVGAILEDQRAVTTMGRLWPDIEGRPILRKYQTALSLCGLAQLDQGSPIFQDVDNVVRLRNALMHFKPEWDDDRSVHQGLERRLRGKFGENPMVAVGSVWFPHRCLSAGCAEWACQAVRTFVDDFSAQLKIKARL